VSYYRYILNELRKEREMQLELDLQPPITCTHCRQVVPQPFWVVKHFGRVTSQLPFCSEEHANEYYLERLRESHL
jgi:hypothetical protein